MINEFCLRHPEVVLQIEEKVEESDYKAYYGVLLARLTAEGQSRSEIAGEFLVGGGVLKSFGQCTAGKMLEVSKMIFEISSWWRLMSTRRD